MAVRAKFYVYEVSKMVGNTGKVSMYPVTRGADNKEWASATPSGKIEMTIKNELAVEFFDVGKEYYVDFSEAPTGQEG